MKAWKYVILVGGLAGLLGFFLPFARGHDERLKIDRGVSAYELAKGLNKKEFVEEAKQLKVNEADAERAATELEEGLKDARAFAVIAYIPGALLALIGVFGVVMGRCGRLTGLFALVCGVASAGIWALLETAAGKASEAHTGTATVTLAMGTHMLLIAGLCGALAGFGAVLAPDKG
jgi:hypothetical protein